MAVRDLLPYLAVAGQVFIFFNVEHLQIQVSFLSFTLQQPVLINLISGI
jgi:hypothetical protein